MADGSSVEERITKQNQLMTDGSNVFLEEMEVVYRKSITKRKRLTLICIIIGNSALKVKCNETKM